MDSKTASANVNQNESNVDEYIQTNKHKLASKVNGT